jgi:hypothetical protein
VPRRDLFGIRAKAVVLWLRTEPVKGCEKPRCGLAEADLAHELTSPTDESLAALDIFARSAHHVLLPDAGGGVSSGPGGFRESSARVTRMRIASERVTADPGTAV